MGIVKLLVGAYARWIGSTPAPVQRIYFANHTSHIDTLAIWSALPRSLRRARARWRRGITGARDSGATSQHAPSAPCSSIAPGRSDRRSARTIAWRAARGDSLIIFPRARAARAPRPHAFAAASIGWPASSRRSN